MEYELIEVGPCRKKMVLKFSEKDIDEAFDESYREINDYVQLKGFRKGRAPRATLERRFSREAASGAKKYLTDKNFGEVVKESKINLLGEISEKNDGNLPNPHQAFTMEFEMDVAPDFDLPEYKGLELTEHPVDVTDEKVDEALERYRKMFANYEEVDEPALEGDVLKVDFVAAVDGEEIMNMKEQRLRVEGEMLFGLPCPELVEKFKGAKKGDTVELTITLPDDHPNIDLRGRPANVTITVSGVERGELPEMDDAFAGNLGMGSLKDFRERIRGNLIREAMLNARTKQEDEIIDKLLAAVDFQVPVGLVNSEAAALEDQQRMRLQRANMPEAEIKSRTEQFQPEAARLADRKVRWGIIATKIGEKESITVTNEDMAQQVEALAQSYNTTPSKIIQRIREFDGGGPMMAEILSIKVMQFIIDSAKGGRLDPDRKDSDTGVVNADAAGSLTESTAGEGDACGCGHDHADGSHHED